MDEAIDRTWDEWLALRCRHGDPQAFRLLVEAMERPLLYYATRLTGDADQALDVLQEVWLRAFRDIRRLKEPKSLRAWLYRMTRGLAVDRLRADGSQDRLELARAEVTGEAVEDITFGAHDAAAIQQALAEVELRHREVLVLHFLEGFSIAEVASILGCPSGTVKSWIHAAKRVLKDILLRGGYGKQS